jgi:hypothetical protein
MEGKTLEELQALIVRDAGWFPACIPLLEERLTALIAAAEKRGEETYKAFVENNDTSRAAIATLNMQSSQAYERGKAEGEERLQKYTELYLAEGIKRCSAALAQGRAEGIEAGLNRAKHWIASQVEREVPVISLPKDGLMDAIALTPPDNAEFETSVLEDERKRLWKAVNKPEGGWCRRRGVNWQCPFYNYESFFIRCELFGEDLIHDDKCEKCRAMNYDDEAAPVLAPEESEE